MSGTGPCPSLWLGQSIRTTLATGRYPALRSLPFMASLGDAIHRPQLVDSVFRSNLRARLKADGPIMLDSGGFTLMSRGASGWSAGFLADIYAGCDVDYVVALDLPPTPGDSARSKALKQDQTLANLAILAEALSNERLVPVLHGPGLDDLEECARRTSAITPDPRVVALGGLVPMLRYSGVNRARVESAGVYLQAAISIAREAFPRARIHVLGAGAPRTMLAAFACGADSVDSVGWRRVAGFGAIFVPGAGERFIDDRPRRRPGSRSRLSALERDGLRDCDCPACSAASTFEEQIEILSSDYMPRAAHNAWTLNGEAIRYREAEQAGSLAGFLRERLPPAWHDVAPGRGMA
jgi:queuine/archaeosine tRNA-ribosyltransferase